MTRRRRGAVLQPRLPEAKRVAPKPQPLDGLDCPNHMAPRALPDKPGGDADTLSTHRFPLLHLHKPAEKGAGSPGGILFVDDVYGCVHWTDREAADIGDVPPTWMDPEIFVRMCLQDQTINDVIAGYIKQGNAGKRSLLEGRVNQLLDEAYLPYLRQQFAQAAGVLCEWLVAHTAYETD